MKIHRILDRARRLEQQIAKVKEYCAVQLPQLNRHCILVSDAELRKALRTAVAAVLLPPRKHGQRLYRRCGDIRCVQPEHLAYGSRQDELRERNLRRGTARLDRLPALEARLSTLRDLALSLISPSEPSIPGSR